MIYILVSFLGIMTYYVFSVQKDIISPAFVFCIVFWISGINVLTNINVLDVRFSPTTVIVVMMGTIAFLIGTLIVSNVRFKFWKICIKGRKKTIYRKFLTEKLLVLLIFNVASITYILREVYTMTVQKAFYRGNILGALSVYAEVSKFSSIDMKVSTISTLLTALCEAEGYVLGYVVVYNLVYKKKNKKLLLLCFITAFISTFCQGSRGGIFMILASVIEYIIIYREKRGSTRIGVKTIKNLFIFLCVAVVIFQLYGVISGKNWDVSVYEYLSVYLGDPLINLNTKISMGIERTKMYGICSFNPLLSNILPKLHIAIPKYTGLSQFQYSGSHNLGNVYTIFAYLIADFGYIGMIIAMFIIGMIGQIIYQFAKKSNSNEIFSRILYGYFLTCIAFSFFSNKICENVNIYHVYMFAFVFLFAMNFQLDLKKYELLIFPTSKTDMNS